MVGYALTGDARARAVFLYGTGANGKSVFVNTLATILGDYATNAPMDTFMETRTDRHPTDLAGLRGARFVAAIETEQGRRLNRVQGQEPHRRRQDLGALHAPGLFEFFPQFKLFVAGNHKPAIRNIDEAMKRRLHLIPFTITDPPERRDKNLTEALAERDGILAWAVAGLSRLAARWFETATACVVDGDRGVFRGRGRAGSLDERCVRAQRQVIDRRTVHRLENSGLKSSGEFVGAQRRFSDLLITRASEKWRNGMGVRGFRALASKSPMPAYTPRGQLTL